MPTGYTAGVENGTVTDVKDYIIQCARAFGATIMMRDEPLSTPIPEKFEPSSYYVESLQRAEIRLAELKQMSDAEIEEEIESEYIKTVEQNKQSRERIQQENNRYQSMMKKVKEWAIPTNEHQILKDFCINQLEISRTWYDSDLEKHYPTTPTKKSKGDWLSERIERCQRDIEYQKTEMQKEEERVNSRNVWIKQLRESLEGLK
jgi:hypothetical protein